MRTGLKSLACGWLLALGVLATGCDGDPPVETSLLAEFVEPQEGQVFTLADDVSATEDGVQVKVLLRGKDTGGRAITLSQARLEVTSDQVDTPVPLEGTLDGDTAEFTVTLGNGQNRLKGHVVEEGSLREAETELEVTLNFERPDVVSVTFPRDADDNGWHSLTELPVLPAGSEFVLVRVTTVRMELGASVRITSDDGATPYGEGTVDATGVAEVLLEQLTTQELADGKLRVELTNLAGVKNRLAATSGGEVVDEEAVDVDFKVDRVPPVVEIVSPKGGVYGDTQDLNVSVRVDAGAGSPPQTTAALASSLAGQPAMAPLTLAADGTTPGLWTAAEQRTFEYGVHDLTVTVTDVAGNPPTPVTEEDIDVRAFACNVAITNPMNTPVLLGRAHDADNNASNGLQYTLTGESSNCVGKTVTLTKGATTVGTTTVQPGGTFSFANGISLTDGEMATYTVTIVNDAPAAPSTDSVTATADLTAPQISNVSPAVTTFFIVTPSNLNLLPTAKPGYFPDLTPGGDGQINFTFRVTGAVGDTVSLRYRGAAVGTPVTLTSATQDLALTDFGFAFPHDTSGVFSIVARDAAGNEVSRDANVTVDVVAPGAPTTMVTVANARLADLNVTWTASGDDGSTGTVAGYDLRWSTELVLPNGIQNEDQYFDITQSDGDSPQVVHETGGLLPATPLSHTVRVPPLNRYAVLVRAADEVGNLSPFTAATNATETTWSTQNLSNPGATTNFYGAFIAADTDWTGDGVLDTSDFDGDGLSDLVVTATATTAADSVYVYFGTSTLTAMPVQTLTAPPEPGGSTGVNAFGRDVSIGNAVVTAVGDLRPDLLVGASSHLSSRGRAFLYSGVANQKSLDPTPIEFRGAVAGGAFGFSSRIVPDINGDGIPEVMIAAPLSGQGTVYLWYGRTRSDWESLRLDPATNLACTVASVECYIPASLADRVFAGPVGETSPAFGVKRGYAFLGNFDSDSVPDFTVPASRETQNDLYVYSGAQTNGKATGGTVAAAAPDLIGTPLTQPSAGTATSSVEGFGATAYGNLSMVGGAGRDLIVSYPIRDIVYVYPDAANGTFGTPAVVTGEFDMGYSLAYGDVNGDGRLDILSGGNSRPPNASSIWLFFNKGVSGQEFDPFVRTGFFHSRLTRANSYLGLSVATGDFNGDGRLDIAAGGPTDASTPTSVWGQVTIWY